MCLKIKSGPHIASRSFYTLKVVKDVNKNGTRCKAYYRYDEQEFNILLESYLKVDKRYEEITAGLHSIHKHEQTHFDAMDYLSEEDDIVLCKIPKGTTFYLGIAGDIVSDRLILLESIISGKPIKKKNLGKKVDIEDIQEAIKLGFEIMKTYPKYRMKPQKQK